jgi:hypothetical protein
MRIPVIVVKIVLLLLAGLFLYSLYARQVDIDDAWLGEHAWYQAKDGYVKSELMRGINHQEDRVLIHHKLLTLHGAQVIHVAGFSLYALKSVSLVYFILFVLLAWWYLVSFRRLMMKEEFILLMLILLAHPLVFRLAFVFRPEIPMMFWGFLTFILIKETIIRPNRMMLPAFAAGMTAGICFGFHLNGLIFVAAGIVVLLFYRNFKGTLAFVLGSILTGLLYFYDFTGEYNLAFWYAQITHGPFHPRASGYFGWKSMMVAFFSEHMRFFHGAGGSSFSLLIIVTLILGWRGLKNMPVISLYSMLLILFLAVIALYKTETYMAAYLAFIVIIMVMIFKERDLVKVTHERKTVYINGIIAFFLVLYLGISFFMDVRLAMVKFNPSTYRTITEKYFNETSKDKRILAPMEFVFDEIGNYRGIQGIWQYSKRLPTDSSYYGKGMLEHAAKNGVDCIYLPAKYIKMFGLTGVRKDSVIAGFRVVGRSPDQLVLDRLK